MTIQSDKELEALRGVGRIVAAVLDRLERAVRPGITTAELDQIAARLLDAHGARSAPRLVYGFPGHTCLSVNDEVVHGVPNSRPLASGDLVKLDVTAEKAGFMADAARTVTVGPADERASALATAAKAAFSRGLAAAKPGNRVGQIGRNVQAEVLRRGFAVIRELSGHGIGRTIHEPPTVPNFDDTHSSERLQLGTVLTIEPIICAGRGRVFTALDGWTVRTADGSLSAHHEHTVVVMRGRPLLLTAA
jgi:methionyl aminopeptidase